MFTWAIRIQDPELAAALANVSSLGNSAPEPAWNHRSCGCESCARVTSPPSPAKHINKESQAELLHKFTDAETAIL